MHISKETYNHLREIDYEIETGNGFDRDSFLKEKKIETFLIKPKITEKHTDETLLKYNLILLSSMSFKK